MEKLSVITGISVIKPTTKQTTDELKKLHYDANKLLFTYNYTNVSQKMAQGLVKKFTQLGIDIKGLEIKKQEPNLKRDEILADIRTIIKALNSYITNYDDTDDVKHAQAVINYRVAQFIKDKEKGAQSEDMILETLRVNKVIKGSYNIDGLKWINFDRMQEELIENLVKKYRF